MIDYSSDDVAGLADQLFDAVYDDGHWAAAMLGFKERLDASTAAVGFIDGVRGTQQLLYGDCGIDYGALFFDPSVENSLLPLLALGSVGSIETEASAFGDTEWQSTTFFNEWCRPQGHGSVLQVKTMHFGDVTASVGLTRAADRPAFSDADVDFIQVMTPTLRRVARLRSQLGAMRLAGEADALDAARVGLAIVDQSGRLLYSNAAAERFLTLQCYGIDASQRVISARVRTEQQDLRRLIATAATRVESAMQPGGDMLLRAVDDAPPTMSISVAPLPDAASYGLPIGRAVAIFMQDLIDRVPDGFASRIRALFDLTPREAELGAILASGGSVKDMMERHSISMPTVRTQLAQLFRKTSTSRQGELVALLLRTLAPRS